MGIFGGTFDPIHYGHLRVVEEVRKRFLIEKILFIPSSRPPHKKEMRITDAAIRFEMVALALEEFPHFEISEFELKKEGLSFTIETLEALKKENSDHELFLIMGVDQMLEINTWKDPERILQLSEVVVMSRPGYEKERKALIFPSANRIKMDFGKNSYLAHWVDVSPIEITSTLIREKIRKSESIRGLLPDKVEAYIQKKGLYKQ